MPCSTYLFLHLRLAFACAAAEAAATLVPMWHAISSVTASHGPIVYEGPAVRTAIVLNAGPGTIEAVAWPEPKSYEEHPAARLEMRTGDHAR